MSTPSTEIIPRSLAERPLIGAPEVNQLASLFRVLASDTRLRILHTIARSGEAAVGDIAAEVNASTQTVSNHLQRMADQQIVATRRDGNRIFYRLIDPCVGGLLELGLCLLGHDPDWPT
ncbi:winged helix-turn-helix transcriptional regulator [Acidimicrobiaceae bacterium AH-315-P05]|nr:winged helix-turn-helix transcriptional regulator [Acidimicrobiaceae bacterium AH-315-P05]